MSKIDYDAMPEDEQISEVNINGHILGKMKNPSEAVCLAAVSQSGWAIQYVKNTLPSMDVQLAAVKQNGWSIGCIKNPSEEVQLAAVSQDGNSIQHIKSPSIAVCMAALKNDFFAISRIKKPREVVQIAAVKYNPHAIEYVPKPFRPGVVVALLLHWPLAPAVPKEILDRAPELLESHCGGLGDVYTIGLSMAMSGEELSITLLEWIESHVGVAVGEGMAP